MLMDQLCFELMPTQPLHENRKSDARLLFLSIWMKGWSKF